MFDLGSIVATLEVNTRPLRKSLDKANKNLSSFSGDMKGKLKDGAGKGAKAIKGLTANLGDLVVKLGAVAGVAAGVGGVFGNKMVDGAEALNQAQKATKTILGDSADEMLAYSDTVAETAGISEEEFLSMTNQMNAVLQNLGLNQEESAERTKTVTERVKDLSTVHNTEMGPAMEAYQALLRGETDQLENYGIVINEAKIKNKALSEGIAEKGEELTEAQKQEARHALFMEQSNNIAGAYGENTDDLTAKGKVFSARLSDLSDKLGDKLIPAKTKVVEWGIKFLDTIEDNEEEIVNFGTKVWEVGEEVVNFAKDFSEDAIPKLKEFHKDHVKPFIKTIKDDFIPKLKDVGNDVKSWGSAILDFLMPSFNRLWDTLQDDVVPVIDDLKQEFEKFKPVLKVIGAIIGGLLVGAIWIAINAITLIIKAFASFYEFLGKVRDFIRDVVSTIIGFFWDLYIKLVGNSIIPDMLNAIWDWFKSVLGRVLGFVGGIFTDIYETVKKWMGDAWGAIKGALDNIWSTINHWVKKVWDIVSSNFHDVWATINHWVRKAWDTVKDVWNNIWGSVKDIASNLWGDVNHIFQSLTDAVFSKFDSWEGHIRHTIFKIRRFFHNSSRRIQDAITGPFNQAKNWIEQTFAGLNIGDIFGDMIRGLPNGQKILNNLPSFANGVQNFAGGPAMINERGPEGVVLPSGTKIIPHSRMEARDDSRGRQQGVNIGTINIHNDADTDKFFQELDRRQYREELIG